MNRVIQLPAGLSPSASLYLAALVQRTKPTDSKAAIYLQRSYAFNGDAPDSYQFLGALNRFAWSGSLTAAFAADAAETAAGNALPELPNGCPATDPFPLVAGCNVQLTGPDQILDEVTDFDGLCGTLLVFVDNEIMSISAAAMTNAGGYSLTVVRGYFGTTIADHAQGAPVFIVRQQDILPLTHPFFVDGNTVTFKLTIGVGVITDSESFEYVIGASSALTFTGFSPDPITAATPQNITITGTGFDPSQDGVFHLSGVPYGYSFTPTCVSSTEMTATVILPAGNSVFDYVYAGGTITAAITLVAA